MNWLSNRFSNLLKSFQQPARAVAATPTLLVYPGNHYKSVEQQSPIAHGWPLLRMTRQIQTSPVASSTSRMIRIQTA